MKLYTLVCPNALVDKENGRTITTTHSYHTLEEAENHKKLCDEWDMLSGGKPKSYIIEEHEDEPTSRIIVEEVITYHA